MNCEERNVSDVDVRSVRKCRGLEENEGRKDMHTHIHRTGEKVKQTSR